MAIKDDADLIANGITSVKIISEGGFRPTILIQLTNGEVLRQDMPDNFRSLGKDELDNIVDKIMDKRRRREKLEKIISKI